MRRTIEIKVKTIKDIAIKTNEFDFYKHLDNNDVLVYHLNKFQYNDILYKVRNQTKILFLKNLGNGIISILDELEYVITSFKSNVNDNKKFNNYKFDIGHSMLGYIRNITEGFEYGLKAGGESESDHLYQSSLQHDDILILKKFAFKEVDAKITLAELLAIKETLILTFDNKNKYKVNDVMDNIALYVKEQCLSRHYNKKRYTDEIFEKIWNQIEEQKYLVNKDFNNNKSVKKVIDNYLKYMDDKINHRQIQIGKHDPLLNPHMTNDSWDKSQFADIKYYEDLKNTYIECLSKLNIQL